jgi:hypothetical protein
MKNLRLKCDVCSWVHILNKSTLSEVKKWHNVPCPQCGKSVIVNDFDLRYAKFITYLECASKILNFFTFGIMKKFTYHIDTSYFRK